jgi:hypothetical protein
VGETAYQLSCDAAVVDGRGVEYRGEAVED